MIVKSKDGWHVHSEGGKNLGGPYRSRAEAVKRLQQVEYFKHHKTAAFGMNVDRQAKLLVGRSNAGDTLTKNEKKLLKQIGTLPTDNTYNKERFWASIPGRALKTGIALGATAAAVTGAVNASKFIIPRLKPDTAQTARNYIEMAKIFTGTNKITELMDVAMANGLGVKDILKAMPTKAKWMLLGGTAAQTAGVEFLKPTIDRAIYPKYMLSRAKSDKKTDSGIDAQLRTQLKKNASTVDMVMDNIDLLNNAPIGNPKKKEELLEALKKIENGSKAQVVMDKIAAGLMQRILHGPSDQEWETRAQKFNSTNAKHPLLGKLRGGDVTGQELKKRTIEMTQII